MVTSGREGEDDEYAETSSWAHEAADAEEAAQADHLSVQDLFDTEVIKILMSTTSADLREMSDEFGANQRKRAISQAEHELVYSSKLPKAVCQAESAFVLEQDGKEPLSLVEVEATNIGAKGDQGLRRVVKWGRSGLQYLAADINELKDALKALGTKSNYPRYVVVNFATDSGHSSCEWHIDHRLPQPLPCLLRHYKEFPRKPFGSHGHNFKTCQYLHVCICCYAFDKSRCSDGDYAQYRAANPTHKETPQNLIKFDTTTGTSGNLHQTLKDCQVLRFCPPESFTRCIQGPTVQCQGPPKDLSTVLNLSLRRVCQECGTNHLPRSVCAEFEEVAAQVAQRQDGIAALQETDIHLTTRHYDFPLDQPSLLAPDGMEEETRHGDSLFEGEEEDDPPKADSGYSGL